ncbi:GNAT superfamily N-acetyltransferase [Arthrobacter ginsengisoli]|uniref:GNAT superfamily N-acetyltransferase n=1 Tax=Arthrobacter ginsengisoli TaxID=1356565 RepID=A0ABU1UGS4_9MICC|nr:GNAT family N-acetyltransferase [Arthrobacter ginsengisoli]MDR7084369.1 GNAT superfamily N-acetyltransferase [Arthrobacter ginsengisoli]
MTAATYRIERLVVPDALDSPAAADFLEFGELCDAMSLAAWGNLDRATPADARLQFWCDNRYRQIRLFFVRQGGRMVARSWVRCELQENLGSALLHVEVLGEFTGRGIGSALLRHAEELAAAEGRTILQSFTEHPADFDAGSPDTVRPATGAGALPAGAPGVRFARHAGYRLEQVERFSALDLPAHAAGWDALEREARAKAGQVYELLSWTGSCPDEYAEQFALLMSRMSTDVPTGELSVDAERWDVARVRHVEDTWQRAGLVSLVAVARHRHSGDLAAYSVLQLTPAKPWLADQDDTLVAADHRGHRLGMLVKIINLRRLLAEYPAVERVITYNAAENEHMLAINIALGFQPAGWDGEWQRVVTGAPMER